MSDQTPEIVETDGTWSYRIGGQTMGRYPSREAALIAADKHTPTEGDAASGEADYGPRDLDNPTPS